MSAATTYAEALFQAADAADDGGAVATVSSDLQAVREAVAPGTDVGRVLLNPEVDSKAKKAAIGGLTDTVHPLVVNLLRVLVDRGRLEELPAVADAYVARVDRASGQIAVEVTSAVPLPDDLRAQVIERITEQTGRAAKITERVDPEIIGGLVLRVGPVVTDASVRGRLRGLRKQITGIHS